MRVYKGDLAIAAAEIIELECGESPPSSDFIYWLFTASEYDAVEFVVYYAPIDDPAEHAIYTYIFSSRHVSVFA